MPIEPLTVFAWPTDGVPLAGLAVRVDDLAARLGVPVLAWDEDGLGPARGLCCRVPSGRVYFLEELELAVMHQGARGPTVYVDAADLGAVGGGPLVAELLAALGLSPSRRTGVVGPAEERAAAELVARVAAEKAARQV